MRGIRRSSNTPMPTAWQALAFEWWKIDRTLTWNVWQALASCAYSEVVTFRQQLLLWPTIRTGREAAVQHGLTPAHLVHLMELLVKDTRLSRREAGQIEDAILGACRADGTWL